MHQTGESKGRASADADKEENEEGGLPKWQMGLFCTEG